MPQVSSLPDESLESISSNPNEVPEPFKLPHIRGIDLYEVTIDRLHQLYTSDELSIAEYTQLCLSRVRTVRLICTNGMVK